MWVWKYIQWIWQLQQAGLVQCMDISNALLMSPNSNLIIVSALQACDITGGIYLKVPHMPSLLQYLLVSHLKNTSVFSVCQMWNTAHFTDEIVQEYQFTKYFSLSMQWVFLPDQEQRSQLVLPPPVHVDYRAACFCHRNLIEIGYVCSVCLSSKFINI